MSQTEFSEKDNQFIPYPADLPTGFTRKKIALQIRLNAAKKAIDVQEVQNQNADPEDEHGYTPYYTKFCKGLCHEELADGYGVKTAAYKAYYDALKQNKKDVFEEIENLAAAGHVGGIGKVKLANPVAGLAYDLEGFDSPAIALPAPPAYNSEEAAAEMAELYWMALLRDIPFAEFETNALVADAVTALKQFPLFKSITRNDLFRAAIRNGDEPGFDGVSKGPMISQFLYLGTKERIKHKDCTWETLAEPTDGFVAIGSLRLNQRQRTVVENCDHMIDIDDWKKIQNGEDRSGQDFLDIQKRFIRNMRDAASYVHFDKIYQEYLVAACIMLGFLSAGTDDEGGFSLKNINTQIAPEFISNNPEVLNEGNPYRDAKAQDGFATFGLTFITSLLAEISTRAHKAVWYQKWQVHRRLRPEEFGGQVHFKIEYSAGYPIHESLIETKTGGILEKIKTKFTSYLLPQVFSEGSPIHPSYGAGHATLAGAAVTILKALFNEAFEIPVAVVPDEAGLKLEKYTKEKLTIGGELNKLASNIAMARSMAGVHWRSDNTESLLFGEKIAIEMLCEKTMPATDADGFYPFYAEKTNGKEVYFKFTKFDGQKIKVSNGEIV